MKELNMLLATSIENIETNCYWKVFKNRKCQNEHPRRLLWCCRIFRGAFASFLLF